MVPPIHDNVLTKVVFFFQRGKKHTTYRSQHGHTTLDKENVLTHKGTKQLLTINRRCSI